MNRPFAVIFAGVPGSSKSIIAYHLSESFGLPVFSTDNIRFEVKEDLLIEDINEPKALKEYELRRDSRMKRLLNQKASFVIDGSVDRRWADIKGELIKADYAWCLVDLELTKDFLKRLYAKTGRAEAVEELDNYYAQHEAFMRRYSGDVCVKITDHTFSKRLSVTETGLRDFIRQMQQGK